MTKNGIYSPPMMVISNTILFAYSLRGTLIKIARLSHAMAQLFRCNQPLFLPPKQTYLGVRHAFLPYSCQGQERVTRTVYVERPPHFLKRSEGIQLRSPTPIIANISHLRSCFDSWACPNHILCSHKPLHKLMWVSALTFLMCQCAGFITQLK